MPRFELEGRTTVHQMLGRLEPSRAIGPGDGPDLFDLGVLPAAAPMPEPPNLPPDFVPPTTATADLQQLNAMERDIMRRAALQEVVQGTTTPMPSLRTPSRLINLDASQAIIDGELITLYADDAQAIMEAVLRAYERQQRDKLQSLRMEYLQPPDPTEPPVQQATRAAQQVVPEVPGPPAPTEPAQP